MNDIPVPTQEEQQAAIAGLSFEDAMRELESIVRQLEQGDGDLDSAISAYARGALLKKHCETKLREARLKVEKIIQDDQGKAENTEPFEIA